MIEEVFDNLVILDYETSLKTWLKLEIQIMNIAKKDEIWLVAALPIKNHTFCTPQYGVFIVY